MTNAVIDGSPVKMILVTGGVISGVGKGIISSSLGVLLKAHGFHVSIIKIDPYINLDAGTFSPFEHGEVFVLDDGGEVDVDLGNYERFLNVRLTSDNSITTGKIYKHVIERERRGDYLGKTVQTIPHVTGAISEWVQRVAAIPVDGTNHRPDVCIIELGGTIGDIEGMPYIAAFERFQRPAFRDHLMTVHVSLILDPKSTGEPKTKPMQNSIRNLRASGLIPDLLVCRSEKPLSDSLRVKIANFAIVEPEQVIGVHDVSNIYKVPLLLHQQNALEIIMSRLKLSGHCNGTDLLSMPNMFQWTHLSNLCDKYEEEVLIAMVGKYVQIVDAYASVNKALRHSAIHARRKIIIDYIDSENLIQSSSSITDYTEAWTRLKRADGIVVPGGFGQRGMEGKIAACKYARENKIPFLGICLGMQCAAIEFARNVCGIKGANSTEIDKELQGEQKIVIEMPEHNDPEKGMGGTMRLGLRQSIFLTSRSILRKLYRSKIVSERHRHRYEINPDIVGKLCGAGLLFVAMGIDEKPAHSSVYECRGVAFEQENGNDESNSNENEYKNIKASGYLIKEINTFYQQKSFDSSHTKLRMEMFELEGHPYYVGVQFHPEYLSHPLKPSPPFFGLVCAASGQLNNLIEGIKIPSPMNILISAEKYGVCGSPEGIRATHSFVNKNTEPF
ncbi:unnamed protein product [Dracunculus medinensis]|uniref:CTP synthase n=1 Tax=Dracunculus medinensis TaxID=318479 RepID=A0A158Q5S7_DRAME|nr:unnamed protein product [Dracunculus medinensis]